MIIITSSPPTCRHIMNIIEDNHDSLGCNSPQQFVKWGTQNYKLSKASRLHKNRANQRKL